MRKTALVILVAGMALIGVTRVGYSSNEELFEKLDLFASVYQRIRADYVKEVDGGKLIEAAIEGMLGALDPHSSYMNADDYKNMQVQVRGQYGGLGMEVTLDKGLVKVIAPIDDTPAQRAGIQSGDYITRIDGEAIRGWTLTQALDRMRGVAGTDITLQIAREGAEEPIEVVLTRAIIKLSPVRARSEGDIAYLRITSFNEQTGETLGRELNKLKKKIGPDLKGYVLDLRNNPGGLLDQAVAVSDAFLSHGEIVSVRGRAAGEAQRFNARNGDIADGKPIVVLINGGSASASEIVAGALQDHHRAILLGTTSFGKGSVQTIIPLGTQGALRLTTAKYFTPSGRSIQALGIEPDIRVEQAKLETVGRSRFRSEADLKGHLENPDAKKDDKATDDASGAKKDDVEAKAGDTTGEKDADSADTKRPGQETSTTSDKEVRDYQLAYALDMLRSVSLLSSYVK